MLISYIKAKGLIGSLICSERIYLSSIRNVAILTRSRVQINRTVVTRFADVVGQAAVIRINKTRICAISIAQAIVKDGIGVNIMTT